MSSESVRTWPMLLLAFFVLVVVGIVVSPSSLMRGSNPFRVSGYSILPSKPTPTATDYGSCDLCADDWLFEVANGRSGSTTLMAMLNHLPGVYIAGENMNLALDLLHTSLREPYLKTKPDQKTILKWLTQKLQQQERHVSKYEEVDESIFHAFYHHRRDEHQLYCSLQNVAKAVIGDPKGAKTIGWKEIRWKNDTLSFMQLLFPCAKFIVNTRDPELRRQSGYFKRYNDTTWDKQLRSTESVRKWSDQLPQGRLFRMDLKDFTLDRFNELASWIGLDGCKFNKILHANKGGYEKVHFDSTVVTCR